MFEIRPVQEADVSHIVSHLGEDSVKAIELCGVNDMFSLLVGLTHHSFSCRTVVLNGNPIAAFGVVGLEDGTGSAWLMAVSDLPVLPIGLIKKNRRYITAMLKQFGRLSTVVWEGNPSHIRWVKFLGFKETGRGPYGTSGAIFHKFILEGNKWD